ncbi:MAG: hypothetical protein GY696_23790 [Gammaproteobacteria bacterium]|nr:hypothetical protein [Gammaproteobacteria bacterium]
MRNWRRNLHLELPPKLLPSPTDQEYPPSAYSRYLVDHDEQILLNTTGSTRMQNCEFGMVSTDHDNLFIAKTSKIPALPVVDPKEVDVALQASVHLNYLAYSLREQLNNLDNKSTPLSTCTVTHLALLKAIFCLNLIASPA